MPQSPYNQDDFDDSIEQDDEDEDEEEEEKAPVMDPAARKAEERRRLDENVRAYDKKLSDFERMFLFINEDLDFKQLSEMAQEVERHKVQQAEGELSARSGTSAD